MTKTGKLGPVIDRRLGVYDFVAAELYELEELQSLRVSHHDRGSGSVLER
jgi:hypothetical protein